MAKQGAVRSVKPVAERGREGPRKRFRREQPSIPEPRPPGKTHRVDYEIHKGIDAKRILCDCKETEVDVYIRPKYLTTSNIAVQKRQFWGYQFYTDDSDLPCILQHTGNIFLTAQPLETKQYNFLVVRLHVQKYEQGMPPFESRESNGLRSRAWGTAYDGARISVQSVARVIGDKITVQETPILGSLQSYAPHLVRWGAWNSSMLSEVNLCFDLLNEPCLCFTIAAVTSYGDGSNRRWRNEVIYLENQFHRFELSVVTSGKGTADRVDPCDPSAEKESPLFRFARLKPETIDRLRVEKSAAITARPLKRHKAVCMSDSKDAENDMVVDTAATSNGLPVPLPNEAVQEIAKLGWTDLQWTPEGLTLNSTHYTFSKLVFARIKR